LKKNIIAAGESGLSERQAPVPGASNTNTPMLSAQFWQVLQALTAPKYWLTRKSHHTIRAEVCITAYQAGRIITRSSVLAIRTILWATVRRT